MNIWVGQKLGVTLALFKQWLDFVVPDRRRVEREQRQAQSIDAMAEIFLGAQRHPIWEAVHETIDEEIVRLGNDLLEPGLKARQMERLRGAQGALVDFKVELLQRLADAQAVVGRGSGLGAKGLMELVVGGNGWGLPGRE
jgi:hypothetical protein